MSIKIKREAYENLKQGQREYLELSFKKFQELQSKVYKKSFFNLKPLERLNTCREIYILYNELSRITPAIENSIKDTIPALSDLIELTKFIRDLLCHYIISESSWDKIYITIRLSEEVSGKKSIYKYLTKEKKGFWVKIAEKGGKELSFPIKLDHPKGYDEKIFLKDIVGEREGIYATVFLIKVILFQFIERDGIAKIFKEGEEPDQRLLNYFR